MDPPSDWVWSSELGRWAQEFTSGTDQYIGGPCITSGFTAITIAAWFQTSTSQAAYLIDLPYASATTGQYILITDTELRCGVRTNLAVAAINKTTTPHNGGWHSAIGIWKPSVVSVILDGGVPTETGAAGASLIVGLDTLSIGQFNGAGYDTGRYTGLLSDPMVWNRVLTPSEIAILANRSDPMLGGLILPPRRKFWTIKPSIISTTPIRRYYIVRGVGVQCSY
jgi:hypothetical protein